MCRCVNWREKMTVLITATGSYVSSCIRACPLTVVGTRIVLLVTWYKGTVKPRFTNASDQEQFGL